MISQKTPPLPKWSGNLELVQKLLVKVKCPMVLKIALEEQSVKVSVYYLNCLKKAISRKNMLKFQHCPKAGGGFYSFFVFVLFHGFIFWTFFFFNYLFPFVSFFFNISHPPDFLVFHLFPFVFSRPGLLYKHLCH